MTSQHQTNNAFSKRHELLAGKVLGNLSSDERSALAEHQPLSAEEQTLLDELQTAHTRMEHQSSPPLSAAVKQRLLQAARRPKSPNRQHWLIGGLVLLLTLTGGELYRSKLQLAQQNPDTPSLAVHPDDRAFVLHATKAGMMHQAHGEVLIRPGQGTNLLTVNHLPQAPQGKLYRLWAITPDGVKGCVHFLPDQGGNVVMTIPPQPTGSATELLISLDPVASRERVDSQPEAPVLASAI